MKTLISLVSAVLVFVSTASAVTWDVVTVSVVVKQGNAGNIVTTVLNGTKYLNFVSNANATPKSDLFIGLREDTGQISVVKRSTETVLYNIVSGVSVAGNASNGTGTVQSISGPATVSSLNTDFTGFFYEKQKRSASAAIKSVNRQVTGGNGTQTIIGTFVTTGKKIAL
jgi:hypothetical protein